MKEIMKEMPPDLHGFFALDLMLYRVDLDGSNDGHIEQVKRLAQNLANLKKLNPLSPLETVFTEAPDHRGQKVHVVSRIYMCEYLSNVDALSWSRLPLLANNRKMR